MQITAEDLHEAADICASFGDDVTRIAEYGVTAEALHEFIDSSNWRDIDERGPRRDMDPLALVIGISIGVIAARAAEATRPASSATIHSTDSRR